MSGSKGARAPLATENPAELFDPAWIDDPSPFFARVREAHPISRVGDSGVHFVSTWELVEEALGREADFSANLTGVLVRGEDGLPVALELPINTANQVIATADEPRHAVHRALSQPRMAARRVAALEAPLRRWVKEALDPWLEAGGGDFVPLAERVPARALARVLGLPERDVESFRRWAMLGGTILAGDLSPGQLAELGSETAKMAAYLDEHLELALERPEDGDDAPLLHALARGVMSEAIAREEAIGIAIVMFGAGGESTAALLASALRRLAEDPSLADTLRAQSNLVPRFVEEMVRLEPPFKFHYRVVRRACTLGGAELEPGDRLMLMWASANRDPVRFDAPDTLRLDRPFPKQHLGFGRGPHFCIGAPLARLEARLMVEGVLARTRRIAPAGPPEYARSIFVRRLERLPIAAESTPAADAPVVA